jgi:hypothetical protein
VQRALQRVKDETGIAVRRAPVSDPARECVDQPAGRAYVKIRKTQSAFGRGTRNWQLTMSSGPRVERVSTRTRPVPLSQRHLRNSTLSSGSQRSRSALDGVRLVQRGAARSVTLAVTESVLQLQFGALKLPILQRSVPAICKLRIVQHGACKKPPLTAGRQTGLR